MGTLSLTKEVRIYNEEKIVSSISGAGKTREKKNQRDSVQGVFRHREGSNEVANRNQEALMHSTF